MNYCSKCGISEDRAILYDAVSLEGVVSFCKKCLKDEQLPVVGRSKVPEEEPKKLSVRERLMKLSGKNNSLSKKNIESEKKPNPELESQNEMLRAVVEKNLRERIIGPVNESMNLIENFHWILMRARRRKCLTKSQLSEKIKEPESIINALEKGLVPSNSERAIAKLENYLSVNIRKRDKSENEVEKLKEKIGEGEVEFDELTTKTLTIEDLRELKERKFKQ